QRVDESKVVKNRMHLDLAAADIEAEAARLEGLGAVRVPNGHLAELGTEWIQMLDPEGNELCVCKEFEDTSARPTLGVSPTLRSYVLDHAPKADPVEQALIDETAAMGLVSRLQIARDQGDLMRIITKLIGARSAIEVGTFTGYSALCVARGLPDDGSLICCDVSDEWTSIGRKYWEQAGVASKIDLRIGPAIDTLRDLPAGEQFDLAFIDADKPSYGAYFDEIVPRLRPNGLLLVDNVLWGGSVVDPHASDENSTAIRAFNDKVAADPRVESVILPISDGITVARKR
ncbi:MAG TPA: class I SAM-dependent methyltransferase, partial [Acidimicrobiales bacterium]|nr:class I SAM-dependent methyltransferase [Acidimicrobiales bacterium]